MKMKALVSFACKDKLAVHYIVVLGIMLSAGETW